MSRPNISSAFLPLVGPSLLLDKGGSRTPWMNPFRGGPLKSLNPERPSTIVLLTLGVLVGCFLVPSLAQVLALTLICYLAYLRFSRV